MRETPASAALRERVIDALITAHTKLRPGAAPVRLATTCADLWDDQLELIELLMEIDAEGIGPELDWQKAPPSSASVNDLIDWIVKELARENHVE